MIQRTQTLEKLLQLNKRYRIIQGSSSAGKTFAICMILIDYAESVPDKTISIVSETFPQLRKGAMRDFLSILKTTNRYSEAEHNKTDNEYNFKNGTKVEFFSADSESKVRGPRRDVLFINEANNVDYETFTQLEIRTRETIWLDYNPVFTYWAHEKVQPRPDADFIKLTYKDNDALEPAIVRAIESKRLENPNWWRVYGLGEVGHYEGQIYTNWEMIDDLPAEARLEIIGLDFGYTNDPTAIVGIYKYNDQWILNEIAHATGLTNADIADILQEYSDYLTVADSAEPKSIDEIARQGIWIKGSEKGKGSVMQGIQLVQGQKLLVTKESVNVIKDLRGYTWKTDKSGRSLNIPNHDFSHCFAPETLVHTIQGEIRIDQLVGKEGYLYSINGQVKPFKDVRPTRLNAEVLSIEFIDGRTLTITPDHEVLCNGRWTKALDLQSGDSIQSVTYETDNKWPRVHSIQRLKLFQGLCRWQEMVCSQVCMVFRKWRNSKRSPRTSYRQRPIEQQNRKSSATPLQRTFIYGFRRTEKKSKSDGRKIQTFDEGVAQIARGQKVALRTWQNYDGEKNGYKERVRSLPQQLFHQTTRKKCKILPPELQDESSKKEIKRITRGFRSVTYDLEVEDTHCLLANGVIAHNSNDATRYGLSELLNVESYSDDDYVSIAL